MGVNREKHTYFKGVTGLQTAEGSVSYSVTQSSNILKATTKLVCLFFPSLCTCINNMQTTCFCEWKSDSNRLNTLCFPGQYEPLTPVSATLELLLVEDVKVFPERVTIYNHPDVRVRAKLLLLFICIAFFCYLRFFCTEHRQSHWIVWNVHL